MSLSLEDLMVLDVVSASKTEEGLYDAPSVISTITSEEIERFGGTNLVDVLERTAGLMVTGTYFMPENNISLRGDAVSHYNRHVLILVNGRPVRETLFGGIDFTILKTIPLQSIKQLEIIRGPGSVLYGSNAYTGVVNIILNEGSEDLALRVAGGSFGTKLVEVSSASSVGDLTINTGLKLGKSDGWNSNLTSELNEALARKMGYNSFGGHLLANYQNLSLTTLISHTQQNNFGTLPVGEFPGSTPLLNRDITSTRFMLDLGYEQEWSDNWRTQFNGTVNESVVSYDAAGGDFEGESSDLLLEMTNFFSVAENINLVAGGTAYLMSAGGELANDPNSGVAYKNQTWYSLYFQGDYRPIESLKLIAGGQLNAPEGVDASFVPRLGAIFNATPSIGIKALYGQAFRTAYTAEQNAFEPPVLVGNPDLTPQTIGTTDIQLFYNTPKIQASVTAFNSQVRDQISITSPPNQTYVNSGEVTFQGIELEGRFALNTNIFINGSYTIQENENDQGVQNVTSMPQSLGKIGISYANDWLKFGLHNMSVIDMGRISDINEVVREVNTRISDFNFVTMNLDLNISQLASMSTDYDLRLQTYVSNLLDEEVFYPEYARRNINSIQGRAGRYVQVGLVLDF